MKKIVLPIILILFVTVSFAQTTFILVRHAEKANDGTNNPSLNEEGKERASKLASILEKQEISALYSTPFNRTRETLQPLAELKSLEVMDYKPFAKEGWLAKLYEDHQGGSVVIVGHSNTIPALANLLLGKEVFSQFDEKEYSNLIVITGNEVGNGKLLRLSY